MGIHDHVTVEGRSNSGIPGLDSLLSGGYPKGSVILVSGTPGTGKTIVCFQFIHEGLSRGEHCYKSRF